MVIDATVNQVDAQRLRVGSKARVRFDAYADLELPAHIVAMAAITKTGGSRTSFVKGITVRLKLDGMDARVIPDLSVAADVIVESASNAALAPLGAIQSDGGKAVAVTSAEEREYDRAFFGAGPFYVLVHRPTGWERREVQLGVRNNIVVAIRSGLSAGEVIALDRPPESSGQFSPVP